MEFESPDVMKEFPGLFASESSKRGNDSDYSDDTEKLSKKELLLKRKEKKDKKDKERRYAVLEGESSAEEVEARSPSKTKKVKAFKFPTKSKEKREKSREKDIIEKKKEKKTDKKIEKEKIKTDKKERKFKSTEESGDIADGLPIFGVGLDVSVERSKCHDGIDIPLPIRNCIDYVEMVGLTMENVYKVSGPKSKVLQIKKLYNQREFVDMTEYDIPTATSLLKAYLRDLSEPIFTTEMLVRLEEAGAILNVATREKHLKILMENLPKYNKLVLSWLLNHFCNIIHNEKLNKMNMHNLVGALSPTLHTSQRLLSALLHHTKALFPNICLETYVPPLTSTQSLPEDLECLVIELNKQESLLWQIHSEMNAGFISKPREELLWEVQRIITQLKRKIKNFQKVEAIEDKQLLTPPSESEACLQPVQPMETLEPPECEAIVEPQNNVTPPISGVQAHAQASTSRDEDELAVEEVEANANATVIDRNHPNYEDAIVLMQMKQTALLELKDKLSRNIDSERKEIKILQKRIEIEPQLLPATFTMHNANKNLDEVMYLLHKENQLLQIKKINLVRQIMEQEELCVDLKSKIELLK